MIKIKCNGRWLVVDACDWLIWLIDFDWARWPTTQYNIISSRWWYYTHIQKDGRNKIQISILSRYLSTYIRKLVRVCFMVLFLLEQSLSQVYTRRKCDANNYLYIRKQVLHRFPNRYESIKSIHRKKIHTTLVFVCERVLYFHILS